MKLAKVDATVHNDLAKAFEIRGFPTLKFFKNGSPSDYGGGRTESEIVAWLSKKIGPAAATLSSAADLEKMQESHEAFALGVFSSLDSDAAKRFMQAAEKDESHVYAYSSAPEVAGKLGVSGDTLVVLKTFDDLRADLAVSADTSAEEIAAFVLGNSAPLVQEFSQESSKKIFGSKVTSHVLFFTDKASSSHADTLAAYREAAKDFKGRALFVNVPTSESKVLDYFDIKPADTPAMVLADLAAPSGIKKFRFQGQHSAAEVRAFVSSYFSGELKPFLKTEQPAPEDTTGDVTVLRGTTFQVCMSTSTLTLSL
ncbi:hypothetical protein EON64_11755 [archaeon]|nr:MAG: hypothetical protein EON64_11755 [archaeon]